MNNQKRQTIFEEKTNAGVRQDKRPPERSTERLGEPLTAPTSAEDRPKHHGSETRKTATISGRAPFALKARIAGIAKAQGLSESEVIVSLIKKALQVEGDLQYGALIRPVIESEIRKDLGLYSNRQAYLSASAFYAAEETRLLAIELLRHYLRPDDLYQLQAKVRQAARATIERRISAK